MPNCKFQKSFILLLPLLSIVLLAAGCNINKPQPATSQPQETQQQEETASQPSAKTDTLVPKGLPAAAGQQTVVQTVEGSSRNQPSYRYTEKQTALQLLKATHAVETKSYGDMGEFVLSIDGIKPDSKHFWEFIVNGKSSNVGASSYILKAGDKVEWKLTEIK